MTTRLPPLPVLLAASSMLLPAAATAAGPVAGPLTSRATLELRVHIPAVLRLLDNRHPQHLDAPPSGPVSAVQELVVLSTLRDGFCATLRLREPAPAGWQVHSTDALGAVDAVGQGYRVCTRAPGRHTLRLEHRFGPSLDGTASPMAWPVVTDLFAL